MGRLLKKERKSQAEKRESPAKRMERPILSAQNDDPRLVVTAGASGLRVYLRRIQENRDRESPDPLLLRATLVISAMVRPGQRSGGQGELVGVEGFTVREVGVRCLRMLVCDCLNGEGIMGVGLARMRLVADLVLPQSGCGASETESVTDVGERAIPPPRRNI